VGHQFESDQRRSISRGELTCFVILKSLQLDSELKRLE
jgi:hypothetical protein